MSLHPFIGSLTELSDNDLSERISKAYNLINMAGTNVDVRHQAILILDSLREEQERRIAEQNAKFEKRGKSVRTNIRPI